LEAPRTYRSDAIVLRRTDVGETDRVIILYTRAKGKLSAIAKGARKALSKLAAATEPFTYGRYMLAVGQNLDVVTQAEIRESFQAIRKDVARVSHAVYFLELVDSFTEEREPNPDLFDTLLSALYLLETGVDPQIAARSFELKLMALLGYAPQLDVCLRCGTKPKGPEIPFSPSLGGLVCRKCGPLPEDVIYISRSTAEFMKHLVTAEPSDLRQMQPAPEALKEAAQVLRWHIRYRAERDLKSLDFLRSWAVEG